MRYKRLAILHGGIGDCVLSIPALKHLGVSEIWAPSHSVSLFRNTKTFSIETTGIQALKEYGIWFTGLRERLSSFDGVYSWFGSEPQDYAFRSEIDTRIGLGKTRFILGAYVQNKVHAAEWFMQQIEANGPAIPRIDFSGLYGPPSGEIIIHPFSGSKLKNWPLTNYVELSRRLGGLLVCGPSIALEGAVRIRSLYALAYRIACARLYIGNDTGTTHIAAAVGTPLVALYGSHSNQRVWCPVGHGKMRICRIESDVDRIESIAKELLDEQNQGSDNFSSQDYHQSQSISPGGSASTVAH